MTDDGRRRRGDASRRNVLEHAADLASIAGLDGLSIGRLATAARVSKSGVATLFGSKEQLQLATVAAARERFIDTVITPARREPRGIHRVLALLDAQLAYSQGRVFPGGCFFAAAMADVDAKPGPVRDAVIAADAEFAGYLTASIGYAIELGELAADTDAAQLAFELAALYEHANTHGVLTDSEEPYARARRAQAARLRAAGAPVDALARFTR
ncbi:TetR/AcrR family transcriptional regulator [Agromyces archimandritae]|uniref:TetR/AcrR family transcriptional regulator n=1 Tax=Agromyces archimandritae TaxID=2781962 RepID=A0A975IMD7_9MICO|nr:TetR/AcrR family transcriptional regulator [Agromyces archimandritae]QTX03368.1 TetR/AcrR family transcriptional regulator [Agromyces archimandritae]